MTATVLPTSLMKPDHPGSPPLRRSKDPVGWWQRFLFETPNRFFISDENGVFGRASYHTRLVARAVDTGLVMRQYFRVPLLGTGLELYNSEHSCALLGRYAKVFWRMTKECFSSTPTTRNKPTQLQSFRLVRLYAFTAVQTTVRP